MEQERTLIFNTLKMLYIIHFFVNKDIIVRKKNEEKMSCKDMAMLRVWFMQNGVYTME